MTTAITWSSFLDHSSDAGYRTYGSELNTKLASVGMVQTADTGQVNWSTATRPAANIGGNYEIWKLSSGNLYFKLEYGSGNLTTEPSMFYTVGTGSNGSGTLTGQQSTRTELGLTTTAIPSTTTNYISYLCASANHFCLSWKIGSASTAGRPRLLMGAAQTVDSTGAATSVGYQAIWNNTAGQFVSQCVATAAGVTGPVILGNVCLIPNNVLNPPANSLDGSGNNQAFLIWFSILGTTPMIPMLHWCYTLATDLAQGVTAPLTLIGTTAHTYMAAATNTGTDAAAAIGAANISVTMVYE